MAFETQTYLYLFIVVFGVAIADCARTGRHSFGSLFVAPTITIVLIISAYVTRSLRAKEPFREQKRHLEGRCRADADPYLAMIDMRGHSQFDRTNFVLGFKEIPREAESVLLILRQTRKRWWDKEFPYTIESLRRQIEALKCAAPDGEKKIEWVCFVGLWGSFAAYQPYDKFRTQLKLGNMQYAELLNEENSKQFREQISEYLDEEKKFKNGEPHKPDIITGLENRMLPDTLGAKPLTKRQALLRLTSQGQSEAMLVTAAERKPLGIVSLKALLNTTFGSVFTSPAEVEVNEHWKNWEAESQMTVTELEKLKPQTPPPVEYGDDSPEREAVLPSLPDLPPEIGNFRVTRP